MASNDELDITVDDHSGILEHGFIPSNAFSVDLIRNFDVGMDQEAFFANTPEIPGAPRPPLRQRRSTIPDAVWEPLKPTIEELYIHQDLQLTDVMTRMKQEYEFDATEQMYKKRLRDWKMRKNYTQTMKQELISKLTREETVGDPSPLLGPNGRPLQAQRLLRNVQRKGARVPLVDRRTYKMLQRKHLAMARVDTISHVQLQQSPESQHAETILRSAQTYYAWYFTQKAIKAQYGFTSGLARVFVDTASAILLLRANSVRRGFALLNRGCSGFVVLLKKQPFQLLQELIREFTHNLWDSHCKVRKLILKMVASYADSILGATHPIKSIVLSLTEIGQEHHHSLLGRFADLLADTVLNFPDADISIILLLGVIETYLDHGQLDKASKLCLRLWDAAQPISSPPTGLQTNLISMKARISCRQKDYPAAEKVLTLGIRSVVKATGRPNGDRTGLFLCSCMAYLYEGIGRLSDSERFYRIALEGAAHFGEAGAPFTFQSLTQLEQILKKQGKVEELARLQDQYGDPLADLDSWELRPDSDSHLGDEQA